MLLSKIKMTEQHAFRDKFGH